MEIDVLGPLVAELDGCPVAPSAAKPRQVLALLAIRAGQVVPGATLIDELWDDRPPPSARATLQTYVMQVRKHLATGKAAVATRLNGYLLDVAPECVDANRYERLVRAGAAAADQDDPATAARLYRDALDMWRGPALVDVPVGPVLAIEVTRLEEGRLAALEARIDAELRLGRHLAVLGDLAALSASHPTHENLTAQYMTALSLAGRPRQALDAFRRLRATLVDELGMEPSARVQHLHREILQAG
ncbi:AfsR/SARP family transcriptional regulator [Pseudonocardia sp. TRM90224]|uniref:AfsR/SARP family transcriptional regulator n=1 Tax=Pseudonocardia sp. TRM90224 TaxID=2812678 RepID=UPI001E50F852|nr:AfsR/SARP family transcriptional regulator [Pseudonocardia sp. TRM90224]